MTGRKRNSRPLPGKRPSALVGGLRNYARVDTECFCAYYRPHVAHPQRGLVPFDPWPFQTEALRLLDHGGPVVFLKARQTGFSTLIMLQKVRRMLERGRMTLVLSRKEDVAAELIHIAMQAIETCDPPYPEAVVKANVLEIWLANGSRLIADSASPEAGRVYAASDLVFDEFAFLPFQQEMWQSARPTVSRGGNVCVVSTPDMEGDLFHQCWLEAEAGGGHWRGLKADWRQCPEYDEDWYGRERPAYPDAVWRREFECEFGHAEDAVFAGDLITHAVALADHDGKPVGPYAIGADIAGEGRDASVIIVLDLGARPARVAEVRSWEVLPAPLLQGEIERAADEFHARPWIDRTGLGFGILGNLKRPATGVSITGGNTVTGTYDSPNVPRTQLINNLVMAFEQGLLAIPRQHQDLIAGLRSYRWLKSKGVKADFVDALAIAWWAATQAVSETISRVTMRDVYPNWRPTVLGAAR